MTIVSPMTSIYYLAMAVICAALCYMIANRNGMNKIGWPILGFLFGIIGLIITFAVAFFKTSNSSTPV